MPGARAHMLMVQGTASYVGKSVLVAALCRLFRREGLRVAPFKAQNISLNAAVTPEGGEIGIAQAVQAQAAGIPPAVEMNPVLLKPEGGGRAQAVVLGRARPEPPSREEQWRAITRSLDALRRRCDLVIMEGAGSPAEINLRRGDLANMRVARYARAPVVLVGDIDRGGVFAALVGTMALLREAERALVAGFVINKFRGDPASLRPGLADLERRTGRPVLGVLPYAREFRLPEEDAVALEARAPGEAGPDGNSRLDVAIVHLPSISNFDEFEALEREPGVRVRYVRPGGPLGLPDLVILPGSKSTVADLQVLRDSGLGDAVREAAAAGVPVIGICGGYQMLGNRILDPEHVESTVPEAAGLALLPAVTTFGSVKRTARVRARLALSPFGGTAAPPPSIEVEGYEIHMGQTLAEGPPLLRILHRGAEACDDPDGAASGSVCGTSVHGLFANPPLRRWVVDALSARRGIGPSPTPVPSSLEEMLDGAADLASRHLDLGRLRRIVGLP